MGGGRRTGDIDADVDKGDDDGAGGRDGGRRSGDTGAVVSEYGEGAVGGG